jgi:SAM-dependent methyltransferase
MTWNEYIEKTKNNPPRPWLIKALDFVEEKKCALDLGCGALVDTKYLIQHGFKKVVALDKTNSAQAIFDNFSNEEKNKIGYTISSFEEYVFPSEKFDLINAQFSIPFISPTSFKDVFRKIKNSLKLNGILVGQFFGEKDSWKETKPNLTFHTRKQVEDLLSDMQILEFKEEEYDASPAVGEMKHWHVFNVIFRK